MKAVILAGGKGTRLGTLTSEIPKPMIAIADKPILWHQMELCKRYGIREFIFVVNHFHEVITNYFGNGEKFGVQISYYVEEHALGTVGGIKAVADQLQSAFLVLYGDVLVNMNLELLLKFHQQQGADATLVLHPNDHPYDSDLVAMDKNDRITQFFSKPHAPNIYLRNLVNAGLYVFEPNILEELTENVKADFGKDIFPRLVQSKKFCGYNTTEYLKDMGTPDRLDKVTNDFLSGKIERSNFDHTRPCIFFDRDGVLNEEVSFIYEPAQLQLIEGAKKAVKLVNESEYISIVVTNQSAVARNLVDDAGLRLIHNKLETELGLAHAKLDDIYYCPHHPHRGFDGENPDLKIECDCRKPKPGMLFQASEKFHIDLNRSWIIGDTERDILAGKSAGCRTIGVQTGMGVRHTHTKPDYMFKDVLEAVKFIVEEPLLAVYKQVRESFDTQAKARPFFIHIGGNSRSGKSTLATYLQQKFENEKVSVLKIELDNWIIPEPDKANTKDVFERFNILQLIQDLQRIKAGEQIIKPTYMHHPEASAEEQAYQINQHQVVIVEGVVALSFPQLRGIANYKIYKEIDDDILRKKIDAFYSWKGFAQDAIDAIYAKRKEDEYDLIKYDKQFAHLII